MKNILITLVSVALLSACGSEPENTNAKAPEATIRAALSDFGTISSIQPSEWADVYEVVVNGQVLYVSADGKHFIAGDLYRSEDRVNLTELQRNELRKQVLAELDPDDAIVFSPEGKAKHTVWVFTDVDCPYCQRFHKNIKQYNKLGIQVNYLAYPRAGKGSPAWKKMHEVWCADDRQAALTEAKNGEVLAAQPDCDNAAVAHDYAAGQAAGLRGTPMIIDDGGRALGGYMTPPQLLQRLQSSG